MQHYTPIDVGHIGIPPLTKAHQHTALRMHVFDRETGLMAIAKLRTDQRRQDLRRRRAERADDQLLEHSALVRNLIEVRHMLKRTAPTTRVVWAGRVGALWCRSQDLGGDRLIKARTLAKALGLHLFAGQRKIDKHGLPLVTGNTAALMREGFNLERIAFGLPPTPHVRPTLLRTG